MTPSELITNLRQQYGDITARELTARSGVAVHHATWQVAAGRVIQFAECTRRPPQITLNDAAIERLAVGQVHNLPYRRAGYEPALRSWFTREQITEVILAHELFHLLTPAPSLWAKHTANEEAAHAFAQSWTGLPFHPTRYEQILWATFSA